ncbi:MAG TPA: polyprenyl synthetase family protein [Syntrophales bacterium]|nr:polyprenyl synthetase family protein [Syntrophales bacterium]HOX94524.1 polyprenyl synthetase family protein [Syntrophales bacterium]HPI58186.1 polyprenyl synthetase family protein [Syntrophales bacterium]HPN26024.1 polyprenyl synthetase family protein [Syntrophales bacterium]HQM30323.1 polyprenyl synthetase family protein [Syntrophales bacterium]
MDMKDVLKRYEGDLKLVEEHLEKSLGSEVRLIPVVIKHLIMSGGKRFRPLMLLTAADLCGYRGERRFPLSAVIEFIHTATLLHDDVIDNADTRRGKPSANNVWGNSASVLVGDFLYSKCFSLMSDDGDIRIIKLMSYTTNIMAEGEVFQLMKSGDIHITEEEYFTLIEKKTAVLISAASAVGAMLAGAPTAHVDALAAYGLRIGKAFQLTDDTLDYVASEKEFGKAIGMDLKEGKITLPLIHALRQCSESEKKGVKGILERQGSQEGDVQEVLSLIHKFGGIDYALNRAKELIDEGRTLMDMFGDSEPKRSMLAIADFILERKL